MPQKPAPFPGGPASASDAQTGNKSVHDVTPSNDRPNPQSAAAHNSTPKDDRRFSDGTDHSEKGQLAKDHAKRTKLPYHSASQPGNVGSEE